jgi:unsaturated pyranuronate lyase
VSAFGSLGDLPVLRIWDGVTAWTVEGERTTLAVVELDPDCAVPEHRHDNEQIGVCIRGRLSFRVGDESRDIGPGDTWSIPSQVPHAVHAGPDGALLAECFTPRRDDWDGIDRLSGRQAPSWPA